MQSQNPPLRQNRQKICPTQHQKRHRQANFRQKVCNSNLLWQFRHFPRKINHEKIGMLSYHLIRFLQCIHTDHCPKSFFLSRDNASATPDNTQTSQTPPPGWTSITKIKIVIVVSNIILSYHKNFPLHQKTPHRCAHRWTWHRQAYIEAFSPGDPP